MAFCKRPFLTYNRMFSRVFKKKIRKKQVLSKYSTTVIFAFPQLFRYFLWQSHGAKKNKKTKQNNNKKVQTLRKYWAPTTSSNYKMCEQSDKNETWTL